MSPKDRDRLLKFCHLLASDQPGERGTAASMANKLAEQLGGWDKVLGPAGQAEQQSSHNPWADYGYRSPYGRDYQEEMRQHAEWVKRQAEAFRREMAENLKRQRAEQERQEAYKRKVEEQRYANSTPAEREAYDALFNANFANAHAQGHDFNNAFGQGSRQWNESDLEKMKRAIEEKMREAGIWKDL